MSRGDGVIEPDGFLSLWSVSQETKQDLLHLISPFALLPVSLPGVAISPFLTLLPRYSRTTSLVRPHLFHPQRRLSVLARGDPAPRWYFTGKPGRAARASLRGASSAVQMHPPVKEEAEIYAPMQTRMLLIRSWHSHTCFQHFQDAVLALHSCFSISDL